MLHRHTISVVIPALNEEASVGRVLDRVPGWVDHVVVADNGSTDATAAIAEGRGATVVRTARRGYGRACLAGLSAAAGADVCVFLDADLSDHPEQMGRLLGPIVRNQADLVVGSRVLGRATPGSLTLPQRWGNTLACYLIRLRWGFRYTDLGPFRAVRADALRRLSMDHPHYGWTVQMQTRALRAGLRIAEVPVDYRPRVGRSKISGTLKGVLAAGGTILATLWRESARGPIRPPRQQEEPDGREKVVVFARRPEPGRTKTRLVPAVGERGAADLQRAMTAHTLGWARSLSARHGVAVELRWAGDDGQTAAVADIPSVPQGDGDLGDRMRRAIRDGLAEGHPAVLVVGTDCPSVTDAVMAEALSAARRHDLVLGPAADGGYYLLATGRPDPTLFQGIDWGTDRVLDQTLAAAWRRGLTVRLLETRSDVDRPEDLPVWRRAAAELAPPALSVIIPAKDEAEEIAAAVRAARRGPAEVLVVDGGSTDATGAIAEAEGARVATADPGRANQMNAGARLATGDVLLFVHADTRLPTDYARAVRRTLSRSGVVAGAFDLAIDDGRRCFRAVEALVRLRSRLGELPYGDQALFLSRAVFDRAGGFSALPVMEDYDLVRRLRRHGRIATVRPPVLTSPRRWETDGVLRTAWINQVTLLAWWGGVRPERIACWRERRRRRTRHDTALSPTPDQDDRAI